MKKDNVFALCILVSFISFIIGLGIGAYSIIQDVHTALIKNGIGKYVATEDGDVNFYSMKINPSLFDEPYPFLGGILTTSDGNRTYNFKYERGL